VITPTKKEYWLVRTPTKGKKEKKYKILAAQFCAAIFLSSRFPLYLLANCRFAKRARFNRGYYRTEFPIHRHLFKFIAGRFFTKNWFLNSR
jgi:hypothetical protein